MAMSFKAKIIGSIVASTMALITLGAGALALNIYKEQQKAAADKVQSDLDSVQRMLDEAARLMKTKTTAAMNVLKDVSGAAGVPSAGNRTEVIPGTNAPNIAFGKEYQAENFRIVDKVSALVGSTATIFSKSDDAFIRIATNVKQKNGLRAIGTILDPTGPAYAAMKESRGYEGVVDILGNPYFTSYQPLLDSQNQLIGTYYVGYEASLSGVEKAIQQARILKTGFLTLVDDNGRIRFSTNGITPELAAATIKSAPEGWQTDSRDVAGWHYKVFAAYPKSELRESAFATATVIFGGGILLAVLLSILIGLLIESMVIIPLGGEPSLASAAMANIASGKLDMEIGETHHGSLLNNLSLMQEKLRNIVNTIQKTVEKSKEKRALFNQALAAYIASKSENRDRQERAELTLIEAADRVAKSEESVSRAIDRLKV